MGIFGGGKKAAAAAAAQQQTPTPSVPSTSRGGSGNATPTQRRGNNGSSRNSIAPSITSAAEAQYPDFSNLKYEVMAHHIQSQALREGMIQDAGSDREGLFLRRAKDDYISVPAFHTQHNTELSQVVNTLNPMVGNSAVLAGTVSNLMLGFHDRHLRHYRKVSEQQRRCN